MANDMIQTGTLTAFQNGDAQQALDAAVESVRDECGWHIAPSLTGMVSVYGEGRSAVLLPSLHVTTVTEVRVDGVVQPLTDYVATDAGVLHNLYGVWPDGALIEVDLTHGYDTTPEALQDVILARATRRMNDPAGNVSQVSKGPFSTQFNTGGVAGFDPRTERDVIRRYKILRAR